MNGEKYIFVKSRSLLRKIYTNEVDYIVKANKKIKVVTENGEYEFYDRDYNLEERLGENFFAILKTVYINMERVDAMYDQCIEFCDGKLFYVGRSKFTAARQLFCQYVMKKTL